LSCGVDGHTTTTPGRCANQLSSDCECCAADESQMPIGMRTTSGTRPWPPNMKRFLAAWLTISSMPHSAKSTTRISTTGRSPASAMPTPAPRIAASLIGVSITRSRAEALLQPLVLAEDAAAAHVLAQHHHARVGFHLVRTASTAASA
jgi:hypothetical protein